MVHLSPEFTPAHLTGMTIHPDNALKFDFLIHRGDTSLNDVQKREEYKKLVKYFLASLTIPDENQWVNLSPYEKDRIIKEDFGKTEMGRDLLAQDYFLKQITSSLIYPESGLGKEFWDKVYERSYREYGATANVPINTFNKVWIVPDEAVVYESGHTVYILKSHLKVMMEEDYLSMTKHLSVGAEHARPLQGQERNPFADLPLANQSAGASQVVREIILPQLEKEVNEGKNFANLRQIYSGMILAAWYKKALMESLLGKVYANKAKVKGVDQNPLNNKEIYKQYLKAFKKGVFNYIKEDVDKYTKEAIPRKYFAGGFHDTLPKILDVRNPTQSFSRAMIEPVVDSEGQIDLAMVILTESEDEASPKKLDEALRVRHFKKAWNIVKAIEKKYPNARISNIARDMYFEEKSRMAKEYIGREKFLKAKAIRKEIEDYLKSLGTLAPDSVKAILGNLIHAYWSNLHMRGAAAIWARDFKKAWEIKEILERNYPTFGDDLRDWYFEGKSKLAQEYIKENRSFEAKVIMDEIEKYLAGMGNLAPNSVKEILRKLKDIYWGRKTGGQQGLSPQADYHPDRIWNRFVTRCNWEFGAVDKSRLKGFEKNTKFWQEEEPPTSRVFIKDISKVIEQARQAFNGNFDEIKAVVEEAKLGREKAEKVSTELLRINTEARERQMDPIRLVTKSRFSEFSAAEYRRIEILAQEVFQELREGEERFKGSKAMIAAANKPRLTKSEFLAKAAMAQGYVQEEKFSEAKAIMDELDSHMRGLRNAEDLWVVLTGLKKAYCEKKFYLGQKAVAGKDFPKAWVILGEIRMVLGLNFYRYRELRDYYWSEKSKEAEGYIQVGNETSLARAKVIIDLMQKYLWPLSVVPQRVKEILERLRISYYNVSLKVARTCLNEGKLSTAGAILNEMESESQWVPDSLKSELQELKLMYLAKKETEDRLKKESLVTSAEGLHQEQVGVSPASAPSPAMRGGIDLNSANLAMVIKRDGRGVPLPLSEQNMAQLNLVSGFEPKILEINSAVNLPIFDELRQKILATP